MYRVGYIGRGDQASERLSAWQQTGRVQLTAFCNCSVDQITTPKAQFYGDTSSMLKAEDLDFLDIDASLDDRPAILELAARQGLPVICNGPLAANLSDAIAVAECIKQANSMMMIGGGAQFQASMQSIRNIIDSGETGKLTYGRLSCRQRHLAAELRTVYDALGLARWLFGDIIKLHCRRQQDGLMMAVSHMNDVAGLIDIIANSEPATPYRIRAEGTSGTVEWQECGELRVSGTGWSRIAAKEGASAPLTASTSTEFNYWLDCLDKGEAPSPSGADGLKTLEAALDAIGGSFQ